MPLFEPIPLPVEHADTLALEWEPLLAFVAGYSYSRVGREAILNLRPSTDQAWAIRQHQLWSEVRLLLQEQVSIPLGGLRAESPRPSPSLACRFPTRPGWTP